jgi:hypothetical protein
MDKLTPNETFAESGDFGEIMIPFYILVHFGSSEDCVKYSVTAV